MAKINSGRQYFGNFKHGAIETLGKHPPGLIVDAGAAAGYVTKSALMFSPESKAICFEPFPGNWPHIEKTLHGQNVEIVKAAVADAPGTAKFFVSSTVKKGAGAWGGGDMTGYSSVGFLVTDDTQAGSTIEVPVTTVDDHVSEHVLFFKIDVQGGELGVLKGASKAFDRGIDMCYVEFSGERDIIDFLLERDYSIYDHKYVCIPKPGADLSKWDVTEEIKLSTGTPAKTVWPKVLPTAIDDFCGMFAEFAEKNGPIQTDIIAVRRGLAL